MTAGGGHLWHWPWMAQSRGRSSRQATGRGSQGAKSGGSSTMTNGWQPTPLYSVRVGLAVLWVIGSTRPHRVDCPVRTTCPNTCQVTVLEEYPCKAAFLTTVTSHSGRPFDETARFRDNGALPGLT